MNRVYPVFFLGGAIALVFEAIWFRLAGLAFGNSVWASSLVLGSFMTGLGLGSFLAAKFAGKIQRPLKVYALLELSIAVIGVTVVFAFPHLTQLLVPLFQKLEGNPLLVNAIRLSASFLLFLIPATAMGATLPILVREFSNREQSFGSLLGRLYAINTAGAVMGVIAAETLLVPHFGMKGSALIAAACGIACAAVIFQLSSSAPALTTKKSTETSSNAHAYRYLIAAALCGATLLALEVVWMRYLLLFINGTSLAFAVVLAIVLTGISIGGGLASYFIRKNRLNIGSYLPHCALLSALLIVSGYLTLGLMDPTTRDPFSVKTIIACAIPLALPVAILSGILFTITGHCLRDGFANESRATGLLTLFNTAGAAIGSAAAGFLMIPSIGVEGSFFVLAFAYIAIAALGFRKQANARGRLSLGILGTLTLLALAFFPFGFMRNFVIPQIAEPYTGPGQHIVASKEGPTECTTYIRQDVAGVPLSFRMLTNGYSMSSTTLGARRYMRLYAYFPFAIRPNPKTALLICFGVGNTAGALTDSRSLESIDIVDISRNVLDLYQSLGVFKPGKNPLADPRITTTIEDGRFFLLTTPKKYDLITAEPPPPKASGVCNLYSKEYFSLIKSRLNDGGVVTYWLPMFLLSQSDAQSITKAFIEVFPDATLWVGVGTNWMLVGTNNLNAKPTEEAFTEIWRDPVIGPQLRDIGFEYPEDFGSLFLAGGEELKRFCGDAPPLVDDYPHRISSAAPDKAVDDQYENPIYREHFTRSEFIHRIWPDDLRKRTLQDFRFQAYVNHSSNSINPNHFRQLYDLLTNTNRVSTPMVMMNTAPSEAAVVAAADANGDSSFEVELIRAQHALCNRDYTPALKLEAFLTKPSLPEHIALEIEKLSLFRSLMAGEKASTEERLKAFKLRYAKTEPHFVSFMEEKLQALQ